MASTTSELNSPTAQPEWTTTRVFFGGHTPILAMYGADRHVEPDRLRQLAEPGTAPPLGPLYAQQVFVDEELTHHPQVVFRAGTSTDAVRMRYGDFAELVHPIVGFTRPERTTPKGGSS
jgi:Ala-tRNA(Pro) deacylase